MASTSEDIVVEVPVDHAPHAAFLITGSFVANTFTMYTISVQVQNHRWTIARRYSQFSQLYAELKTIGIYTEDEATLFPPKKWWGSTAPPVVEQRKHLLQVFLDRTVTMRADGHLDDRVLAFVRPVRRPTSFTDTSSFLSTGQRKNKEMVTEFVDPFQPGDDFWPDGVYGPWSPLSRDEVAGYRACLASLQSADPKDLDQLEIFLFESLKYQLQLPR